MNDNSLKFLHIGDGAARRGIAVRAQAGAAPGLFWLGGYKSDMKGTKAEALADWAAQAGRACVRFDYSGHGESEGAFTDGTIGRWLADSLAVFDACCAGPQILIGSSMGGWLALLLTRELKRRGRMGDASVAGMVRAVGQDLARHQVANVQVGEPGSVLSEGAHHIALGNDADQGPVGVADREGADVERAEPRAYGRDRFFGNARRERLTIGFQDVFDPHGEPPLE